jgi:hypothetical protein
LIDEHNGSGDDEDRAEHCRQKNNDEISANGIVENFRKETSGN